jgi:hypothetical protein
MLTALKICHTEAGCRESIACAKSSAIPPIAQYIEKYWEVDTQCWAHWARAQFPLLLQSSTTNAAENWHKQLKRRGTKYLMKGTYSLTGAFCAVAETLADYESKANLAKINFRTSTTVLGERFPYFGFEKLPGPIQVMILEQVEQGTEENHPGIIPTQVQIPGITKDTGGPALEDDIDTPAPEDEARPLLAGLPSCTCHWYRKWQLPCQHIWLHQELFGLLQPENFTQLITLWECNGYEIYSELQGPFDEAMDSVIGLPSKVKVEIKYTGERVTNKAWCLLEGRIRHKWRLD